MLLGWWPYAAWKGILEREPNTTKTIVRRHKLVTTIVGTLITGALCLGTTFGIQSGNDRKSTAQVEAHTREFRDLAQRIGVIKTRNLKTTQDYVEAYDEINPLLVEFDGKLQQLTDILAEARQRERNRGPLNVQHLLYGNKEQEWLAWDVNYFELLRQDNELTKDQVLVIRQMAQLPEEYQVGESVLSRGNKLR
jgi:hypothetical protein